MSGESHDSFKQCFVAIIYMLWILSRLNRLSCNFSLNIYIIWQHELHYHIYITLHLTLNKIHICKIHIYALNDVCAGNCSVLILNLRCVCYRVLSNSPVFGLTVAPWVGDRFNHYCPMTCKDEDEKEGYSEDKYSGYYWRKFEQGNFLHGINTPV